MKNTEFDLPAFLLRQRYHPEQIASGWTLADAINLADHIRKYDGEDCDPQEIYEIMLEFARQDAEDEQL